MFSNTELIKTFVLNNKKLIIPYILVICLILPLEAIGFSKYVTKIIENIKKDDVRNILMPLLMICIIFTVTKVLSTLQYILQLHINVNLTKEVREKLFNGYIDMLSARYKEVSTGKIISTMSVIPHIYEDMVYEFLHTILPYGITIIILAFYFFYVDPKLGSFLLVSILLLLISIYIVSKKCIKGEIDKYKLYHSLSDNVQDKITNIYSVIANNEVSKEKTETKSKEEEYRKLSLDIEKQNLRYQTILNFMILLVLIISLAIFYYNFKKNNNKGLMVASLMTFFYMLKYISSVKWNLVDFLSKFGILTDLEKDFVNKDKVFSGGSKKNFIKDGDIKIHNLRFSYDKKEIIKNLNLDIKPNKITTILGQSGSGKTTLLKLLMGFYPFDGDIIIDGVRIKDADISYLRDSISVVNQNIGLFDKSIYDNIKYGNNISNVEIDKIVKDLDIKILGDLNKIAGVNGANLSNGQKQFILLVRAFIKNRKILILDEPTSSLDKNTKQSILSAIKKISKNKTTIIVTHDHDIKQITDTIINFDIIHKSQQS